MILTLQRSQTLGSTTIGRLFVNGVFQCYTLEDQIREPGVKVPGTTAIPPGDYAVTITLSARFGRELPLLHDVPNFTGIRIHAGNTDRDTAGCILVGKRLALHGDRILDSREALQEVLGRLRTALDAGESVRIQVRNSLAEV